MAEAALWGLIQGLTEFLPISSSGHLVIVPALLERDVPGLATSALLHLGTLVAVVVYFRGDLVRLARYREDDRRMVWLLLLATIPAALAGLLFGEAIDDAFSEPYRAGWTLMATGVVLLATQGLRSRNRSLQEMDVADAAAVGFAQAIALVPGISRSGMTISAGLARRFAGVEAARFSFLLGVPVIMGAGLAQAAGVLGIVGTPTDTAGVGPEVWVGMGVAAVSGYAAIALLLRMLSRTGLVPFGFYCLAAGALAVAAL